MGNMQQKSVSQTLFRSYVDVHWKDSENRSCEQGCGVIQC